MTGHRFRQVLWLLLIAGCLTAAALLTGMAMRDDQPSPEAIGGLAVGATVLTGLALFLQETKRHASPAPRAVEVVSPLYGTPGPARRSSVRLRWVALGCVGLVAVTSMGMALRRAILRQQWQEQIAVIERTTPRWTLGEPVKQFYGAATFQVRSLKVMADKTTFSLLIENSNDNRSFFVNKFAECRFVSPEGANVASAPCRSSAFAFTPRQVRSNQAEIMDFSMDTPQGELRSLFVTLQVSFCDGGTFVCGTEKTLSLLPFPLSAVTPPAIRPPPVGGLACWTFNWHCPAYTPPKEQQH